MEKKQKKGKMVVRFLALVAIDQISKYLFFNMRIGESLGTLTPLINYWISRSIMINKTLVIIISIIAIGVFIYLLKKKILSRVVVVFFLAGTVGNLWDRIIIGWVRDFLDIGIIPIFNAADVFLNIGILLMIFQELSSWKKKREH